MGKIIAKKITDNVIFLEDEINNLLDFYSEKHIHLKRFEFIENEYHFTFKKFNYPYFKKNVTHLTREQTVAYVTQAAYFLGIIGYLFEDNWDYSLEKFYEYIENEKMGFTDVNIHYKKFEENCENIRLIFHTIKYRKLNGKYFGEITFELGEYCNGKLNFFIDL